MPHVRVAGGYAVCAALFVLARRMERNHPPFARVLYGAVFAVGYFVTFATHYVTFARVFATPVPTLVLLAGIVAAWAIAAQVRKSRTIACMAVVLGHLTIFLSTVTLAQPESLAVVGIVFLSAGSAFFLLRNRWYYIAALGMAGSYFNHAVYMARAPQTDSPVVFTMGMAVLAAYLLIFALAELFAPHDLRRKTVPHLVPHRLRHAQHGHVLHAGFGHDEQLLLQ